MAGDSRLVRNRHGVVVRVDVGRDMDEATFNRMVEAGDFTVEDEPKPRQKKQ